MPKKKILIVAVLLIGVASVIFGIRWWTHGRFIESTDDAYITGDISTIAPKVAGYIKIVAVEDGQRVKAGDLLITIDDEDYKTKVDQATGQVAAAEAALTTNASRIEYEKDALVEAQTAVDSAQADLAKTSSDLQRYQKLRAEQFASTQRFESAQADQRKSLANLEHARAALASEQGQSQVLVDQQKELEAQLTQAKANLDAAQINLANTKIVSPIDGVVGNRLANVGQYVKEGTVLMAIVPVEKSYIVANFKETQIGKFHAGDEARIYVDAYPNHVLKGRVSSLAPASGSTFSILPPENATGNFTKIVQRMPVRIDLDTTDPLARNLRPGLSVEADIDTRVSDQGHLAEAK